MIVAGDHSDFDSDPFSDSSHPVSPIEDDLYSQPSPIDSHTTAHSSLADDGDLFPASPPRILMNDAYAPLRTATIQCCRCPNSQPLFTTWDIRSRQRSAACDACTSAFCAKCEITSAGSVVQFDGKSKAAIPPDATDVQACWFCPSCGAMEDVAVGNVRRMRGVGEISVKGLSCGPCRQKAGSSCLKVAWWMDGSAYGAVGAKQLPLIQEREPVEGIDEGEVVENRKGNEQSDYSSIRQRMSLKNTRTRTVNRMRRWTSLTSFRAFG
jgi:hypothetical protein